MAEAHETADQRNAIGRTEWVIAEGYIPSGGTGGSPALESHETACILNASDSPANVEITIYFSDREPAGPYRLTVQPRRTLHQRFNDLSDPEDVPRDTDYAAVIRSDVPIVVQHTRLDSRQSALALLSTIAWAG
ncbi:sensory rhodopsin transducer [Ruicaihuangia caeni]|uniref:Sensory rhodopsin transducer n=1 Tax=Ruicaihuangia caeni TaxID=3042517 RepID=A0AAW6T9G9_9MICO|nr:sensory rhodopsin transducer [Klugiella sp. YN-L-19]MDI2098277.1 sensory rhodopsin transducer [Klugiella sp. YN-L-19]